MFQTNIPVLITSVRTEHERGTKMTNNKNGTWVLSDIELGALMYGAEDAYNLSKHFTHQYGKEETLKRLLEEYSEKRNKMGE